MAKHDSKSQPVTTKDKEPQVHYFLVGYRPNNGRPNPIPQLTIKGRWMEAAGFDTGQPVIITVEKGKMVIETEFKF